MKKVTKPNFVSHYKKSTQTRSIKEMWINTSKEPRNKVESPDCCSRILGYQQREIPKRTN